jgi:hypothetical protein
MRQTGVTYGLATVVDALRHYPDIARDLVALFKARFGPDVTNRAAVEAARALPFPFVLTARAENFFGGAPDLQDTIRRLQAYQAAGADVLVAGTAVFGAPDYAAAIRALRGGAA